MTVKIERYKGFSIIYGKELKTINNELVNVFNVKSKKKYYILPFYNFNKFVKFLYERKFNFHIINKTVEEEVSETEKGEATETVSDIVSGEVTEISPTNISLILNDVLKHRYDGYDGYDVIMFFSTFYIFFMILVQVIPL